MGLKNFISIILISFILSCGYKQPQQVNFHKIENETKNQNDDNITGTYYHNHLYFSSKIELKEDYIFEMTNGSCLGESIAQGNWTIKNDTILILNSFEPVEEDEKTVELDTINTDNIIIDTSNDSISYIITISPEGDVYPPFMKIENQMFLVTRNKLTSLKDTIAYLR